MRTRSASQVAAAIEGTLTGEDVELRGVVTDSRESYAHALFVALPGPRTNGALFVEDAFERGAAAAIVPTSIETNRPTILVESPGDALLRLAAHERRTAMADATIIGVTGANGKTSTKDLAASMLAARFLTHANRGSLNNEIGLPTTLLEAPEGVEVVVAEMGARRPGDTHLLCEVARPTVAVVTNVGLAHIEVFGSWESIVEASAEPVEALPNEGVAVLFADDPIVLGYARRTSARVVTFGVSADADVRARNVRLDPEGRPSFELTAGDEREHTELAVVGEHMVANALAATACGIVLGMSPAECAAGLKGARVSPWRMETFTSRDGIRVLNDAYNANPESTAAALRTARRMARGAGLVAVLGTMAELGVVSVEQHTRIGALAARIGVERLIVVGADARPIADAAVREGMDPQHIATLDDHEEALEDVLAHARPGDVVLLKASRVVGLERMARALR